MSRQRGVNRVRSFAEVANQHVSVLSVFTKDMVADLAYVYCYPWVF